MSEQTKKYELLQNDTVTFCGRVLYRIKALISFNDVQIGELGGYIENEANLAHNGNAWVSGNAKVCGNAEVFGNANVSGNAIIRSFADISEEKMIFCADYVGSENGTLTVFNGKDGLIVTRGCFVGSVSNHCVKNKSHRFS